jgi:hypothetical protein
MPFPLQLQQTTNRHMASPEREELEDKSVTPPPRKKPYPRFGHFTLDEALAYDEQQAALPLEPRTPVGTPSHWIQHTPSPEIDGSDDGEEEEPQESPPEVDQEFNVSTSRSRSTCACREALDRCPRLMSALVLIAATRSPSCVYVRLRLRLLLCLRPAAAGGARHHRARRQGGH